MHDINGTELKVGDAVFIPCDIISLSDCTSDFCNITVETAIGRRPDGEKLKICLNTQQVFLVAREK